ncbi:MAG TPA: hypothetical protein VKT72_10870 [Candidatus Baltobacteraceae bacterium]|nr:hypothetical protein [Candidatus Baltobacteraceae bacterium]
MRTVLAVTIALALCAPLAARAAQTDPSADLNQMVSSYQQVRVVRVVERFEDGTAATVDVMPSGQVRVAGNRNLDPALVVQIATHPVPNLNAAGSTYTTKAIGVKTLDGVKVSGYSVTSADGSYSESVWVNEQHLPVYADVKTQGHTISVQYGDYGNLMLIGMN